MKTTKMKALCLFILVFCGIGIFAQTKNKASFDVNSKTTQAKNLLNGLDGKRDADVAIRLLMQYAKEGNTDAMIELGHIYNYGIYAQRNIQQTILWYTAAGEKNNPRGWYYLGTIFKNASDSTRNFEKAYQFFAKGTIQGDINSTYAQGYMLFKGLGIKQDYNKAFQLFSRSVENENSSYFLGLCYRNGYGVTQNETMAKYWLDMSIKKGNYLAKTELQSEPENSNTDAVALAKKYKNTTTNSLTNTNKYQRLDNVPTSFLEGTYTGHIIRYDWSGKYPIGSSTLALNMVYKNGALTGTWQEADSLHIPLKAIVTPTSLLFKDMVYAKKDHYSQFKPMLYSFENAKLNWVEKNGETFLQGEIKMFSVKRNEPEKPLAIFLKKTSGAALDTATINLVNDDGSAILLNDNITAFPNPFNDIVMLNFKLINQAHVVTKLLTIQGKLLYKNDAGLLAAGYYSLPVKTSQHLNAGVYILALEYGNYSKTIKIVKN